jgi:hypothetical protein
MIATFAAHAADVDWKVYGFASVAGTEVCFLRLLNWRERQWQSRNGGFGLWWP